MEVTKGFEIIRITDGEKSAVQDRVIVEHDLAVYVNGELFVDMLCTPKDLECLVYGHLFAEGVIGSKADVEKLTIDGQRADVILKPAEQAGPKKLGNKVLLQAEDIFSAIGAFHGQSELFAATGGVHNCELHHLNGEKIFMEDLGRHNAGDKALGKALLEEWDLSQVFMITSGRVPKYMAQKAINTGISIVISKSAPTDQAVELARAHNLTLCGFVRGNRMNIYSAPERILGI
ncbi:MAG: formate dehydrogenase accessory sulfurtransferase FdhD [Firmicutes bacterium]|nr:formate dehydrogenase accessory sulfurtransferase FdhD [Bacillota bacterium]